MRPKPLLVLLALALTAACSDDDEGAAPTTVPANGCPVATAVVADAIGHRVTVDGAASSTGCTFGSAPDGPAGTRVDVVVQDADEDRFEEVLADVQRRTGPTVALPGDAVDGAARGWIATVGRAVQVGAAGRNRLVVVAVADPVLDADAARDAAFAIAAAALQP